MLNQIHYNYMPINSQLPQSNLYSYQQQPHHHHHHHHHNSHHSSPLTQIPSISSYSTHHVNNNNNNNNIHHHQLTPISTSSLSSNQSSAYFLDRIDLENYTTQTLKKTVDTILSKTKSKGLKVKLSLPDDGLIIDNKTDPNQSWIFKTSELLYFWGDPYYLDIIVVVTNNRTRHHPNRIYSASVFRLRNIDSAQIFLQRAQQFFANLPSPPISTSNVPKSNKNKSVVKSSGTENRVTNSNSNSLSKATTKTKLLSTINEQSSPAMTPGISYHEPSQTTTTTTTSPATPTVIRRVTRAEFEPGKIITESITNTDNHRTYSETSSSADSQIIDLSKEGISYTKKLNDDEDDKMTINSTNLSGDQVADLMRELKELRNEIALLKLEKKIPLGTRSMSTSPLAVDAEHSTKTINSLLTTSSPSIPDITSQSEVDAETQTDFSLNNHRRRQTSRKNKKTMIGSSIGSTINKKKSQKLSTRNLRTLSNSSTNTTSDQEETSSKLSSQVNDSSNDTNSLSIQDPPEPVILSAPPRPVLIRNQKNSIPLNNSTFYTMSNSNHMTSNSNSIEEGSLLQTIPVTIEKEMPNFLSTNIPSSNPDIIGTQIPIFTAGPGSFQPSLENLNNPTEHIYENVPTLLQQNSNRESYYNIPIINVDEQKKQEQQYQSNGYIYYGNISNGESEPQQKYLIPGSTISNSPAITIDNNSSEIQSSTTNIQQQQKPQIVSAGRHRNQPIFFANHLTNPVFNVDKQLLINTIANQFGVDLNSPQLQQLITNQHLFAARKRTFANMVWQLTPDEEIALCSPPPPTTQAYLIDVDTINSKNSTSRPILKTNPRLNSTTKRRNITWNSTLE